MPCPHPVLFHPAFAAVKLHLLWQLFPYAVVPPAHSLWTFHSQRRAWRRPDDFLKLEDFFASCPAHWLSTRGENHMTNLCLNKTWTNLNIDILNIFMLLLLPLHPWYTTPAHPKVPRCLGRNDPGVGGAVGVVRPPGVGVVGVARPPVGAVGVTPPLSLLNFRGTGRIMSGETSTRGAML